MHATHIRSMACHIDVTGIDTPSDAFQVSSDSDWEAEICMDYHTVELGGDPSDGRAPLVPRCDHHSTEGCAIVAVVESYGKPPVGKCYRIVWQGRELRDKKTKLRDLFDGHETLDDRVLTWILTHTSEENRGEDAQ